MGEKREDISKIDKVKMEDTEILDRSEMDDCCHWTEDPARRNLPTDGLDEERSETCEQELCEGEGDTA